MKVVVIGGGSSGVIAALTAKRGGHDVIILERNDKVLKKLLITGNGRCNYFNDDFNTDHYCSFDKKLLKNIINEKNKDMFLSYIASLGIVPRVNNGYYYPYSNQASSIRDIFCYELERLNIKVRTLSYVNDIKKNKNKFYISCSDEIIICDKVIVSCGSKAYPKTGSDGNMYSLLEKFGHTINEISPGLVKLIGKDNYYEKWNGVRSMVTLSLYKNNNLIKQESGEMQATKDGISGICVFNLSNLIRGDLSSYHIRINFMPFCDDSSSYFDKFKNKSIYFVLEGFLNYKLVSLILSLCHIDRNRSFDELSIDKKRTLISYLTSFKFNIHSLGDYNSSQICIGGVSLDEIDLDTMESKVIDGLYITGEVLDVAGDCGGYNLAFAFITGLLAGGNL